MQCLYYSVYGRDVSSTSYNGSSTCIAGAGKEVEVHVTYDREKSVNPCIM